MIRRELRGPRQAVGDGFRQQQRRVGGQFRRRLAPEQPFLVNAEGARQVDAGATQAGAGLLQPGAGGEDGGRGPGSPAARELRGRMAQPDRDRTLATGDHDRVAGIQRTQK